jgi:hypothetical protein
MGSELWTQSQVLRVSGRRAGSTRWRVWGTGGTAGRDVYQILREAIGRSGRVALSRVVIGQRERVIALRIFGKGLAAHTLYEQRDLNDARDLFDW